MKKALLLLLFFLSFSTSVSADDVLNNIGGGLDTNTTSQAPIITNNNSAVANNNLEQIFCDSTLLYTGISGQQERSKNYETARNNKIIIETFANVYGTSILKEYKISAFTISLQRETREVPYQKLEELCLTFRQKSSAQDDEIDNLYTQVRFFSNYYDSYPEKLRHGVMPGFLIFLTTAVETLSFYLVWISFFNIIFWVVAYGLAGNNVNKQASCIPRIKMAILYFFIVWAIRTGIVGSILAFVGYNSLDVIKLLFNF